MLASAWVRIGHPKIDTTLGEQSPQKAENDTSPEQVNLGPVDGKRYFYSMGIPESAFNTQYPIPIYFFRDIPADIVNLYVNSYISDHVRIYCSLFKVQ